MQGPQQCPHCDHTQTKQMPDRPHEAESSVTWYQCLSCERMWSRPKLAIMDLGGQTLRTLNGPSLRFTRRSGARPN